MEDSIIYKVISLVLKTRIDELATKIAKRQYDKQPELLSRYDQSKKESFFKDIIYNLNFLSDSINLNNPTIFNNYMDWLGNLLKKVGVPFDDMIVHFQCMSEVISEEYDEERANIINNFILEGSEFFKKAYLEDKEASFNNNDECSIKNEFLSYLLNYEKDKAAKLVLDNVKESINVRQVYMDIIQPVLYEIGELWHNQKISVAKEHYCTAVIQNILSMLYPYVFKGKKINRTMVSACAGPELHEIGIRMVMDFFELEGWDTYYLGANMPVQSIIDTLKEKNADMLAVSTTMTFHIDYAEKLIKQIRQDDTLKNIKIIVGGRPFNMAKDLWREIGADGYGKSAEDAIIIAKELISN